MFHAFDADEVFGNMLDIPGLSSNNYYFLVVVLFEILERGCDVFIQKPFNIKELPFWIINGVCFQQPSQKKDFPYIVCLISSLKVKYSA